MNSLTYNEILLKLLDNNKDRHLFNDTLLVNIYITLLSLNNHYYSKDMYIKELDILEDFLRKINNLKVKIQLKRKQEEVDALVNAIKEIYNSNKKLIDDCNKKGLNVLKELETKNPVNLTSLIDDLTKEKMHHVIINDEYTEKRDVIINMLPNNKYHIDNDTLYIGKDLSIKLEEFYIIFGYLLNSTNYAQKYGNDKIYASYMKLLGSLINLIVKRKLPTDETIIPIILTYLLAQDIDYSSLTMNRFNILNIKITDLYSFANKETNSETAKWKNISIPNEYLYNKIKEISSKGMYYYADNEFIIENVTNYGSDFKISINISDMKEFLIQNIMNIQNQSIKSD